jgi:hypothetical protein
MYGVSVITLPPDSTGIPVGEEEKKKKGFFKKVFSKKKKDQILA